MTPVGTTGLTVSPDGTAIAWFRSGDGPPIVLVHGATADHTAWRTTGPWLAASHTLYAIDRRGRGASGDTAPYAIAREYEDVAAVVDAVAAAERRPVDVVGHSFGGRVGLGAALLTGHLRRLVVYEGAPAPDGRSFHRDAVMARLESLAAADDREGLLSYFLATVVGMTPDELAAYRVAPTWPARVEAAPTVVREMWAEATEDAGPERYAGIRIPVLQLVGGDSSALFTDGTWALDRLLPSGRVVVIPGAKHAAHHSQPERFAREVRSFLEDTAVDAAKRLPGDNPGFQAFRSTTAASPATYHSTMTDTSPTTADSATPSAPPADTRPYSPGLADVIGAESAIGLVDGKNGRLLYRGYPIGQLVARGTYAEVADLLWTGEWHPGVQFHPAPVPEAVLVALRVLPHDAHPMDALRTAVSVWGATRKIAWPPTPEQARALTAFSPSALAAFDRIRRDLEPIQPDESLDLASGFLQQLTGKAPDRDTARALEAYFIVGAEHGLNASTFTARVITATRSDLCSAVVGAIGALKGPLHGGAPAEVVNQLLEIGSPERAEAWLRETVAAGGRIMGFGHRVYRAYDPRAAALRQVAEMMDHRPDWLNLAIQVEDVVLRVLAELKPGRVLKTNVEYYAAAVLQGVGLTPDLFPATFALARHAGWTAHAIEQVEANKLIRPDMRYTGPAERDLPA